MSDEGYERFKAEFKDLCDNLHGHFKEENFLGEMVCVLKGAVLYGEYGIYEEGKGNLWMVKKGKDVLMIGEIDKMRTTLTSRFLYPISTWNKFGKHFGCFIAEVGKGSTGMCLNEKGEIVLVEVFPDKRII